MSDSEFKRKICSEVSIEELIRNISSETLTPLEVSTARINLFNFFETLVEIAQENPELMQEIPDINLRGSDNRH